MAFISVFFELKAFKCPRQKNKATFTIQTYKVRVMKVALIFSIWALVNPKIKESQNKGHGPGLSERLGVPPPSQTHMLYNRKMVILVIAIDRDPGGPANNFFK